MFLFNIAFIIIGIVSSVHLPKGFISHPETGLFFQHVGRLAPNERLMNLTMFVPVSLSGCYLVPLNMAKTMSVCSHMFNYSKSIDRPTRVKRDPFGWIMGGGALIVGTLNTIAITDLQSQITSEANKIRELQSEVKVFGTTLATVRDSAILLSHELKDTQNLITDQGKKIIQLETNDAALNESIAYLARDQQKLHLRLESSLLYQSLMEIYDDRPSLLFLAPNDVNFVIAKVFDEAKLNYTSLYGHLPALEAIRMLLTVQAISFHPSTTYSKSNPDEIGRFIITNYFALPQPNVFYNVYRLNTIPFYHNGLFIRLARIPMYIAQHVHNNNTIEWNSDEIQPCRFGLITICKDIPSIGNGVMTSRCIEQILHNEKRTQCRYEPVPSANSFRVKLMNSWWAISSETNITCLKQPIIPTTLISEHQSVRNTRFVLPAVALIHIERGTVLSCDDFQLIGKSAVVSDNITVFVNNTFSNQVEAVFDVQKQIKEGEARNPHLPIISSGDIDKIISMLEGTKINPLNNFKFSSLTYLPWSISIISIIILLTCVISVYCLYKGWLRCPSILTSAMSKTQIINKQRLQQKRDIDLLEYYQEQLKRKNQVES